MPKPLIAVKDLRDSIVNQIWPSGAPENLENRKAETPHIAAPFELAMIETLAEIQRHVECEKQRHVDGIDFCKTYYKNCMTIVGAPYGVVLRVYTICNENWDDPVFYAQKAWPFPEDFGRNQVWRPTNPMNAGMTPALANGFFRAESSLDRDTESNAFGRARAGHWAMDNENIYIAPWLQSNERLIIEWKGEKHTWSDTDMVNGSQLYRKCAYLFFQYLYENRYGDKQAALALHQRVPSGMFIGEFDTALADLISECKERRRVQDPKQQYGHERPRTMSEIKDDALT